MKVLCDFHHDELYESILKLFEDRLGWEVYKPIGEDWFLNGCWKILPAAPATISQYLSFDGKVNLGNGIWTDTFYHSKYLNRSHHRCIEYQAAKDIKWDIVVSTLFEHFSVMEKFIKNYCPSAKHILQLGNVVHVLPPNVKNILNSTSVCLHNNTINHVYYCQEFSLNDKEWSSADSKSVVSMLHFNPEHNSRVDTAKNFYEIEKSLPSWTFREYGAGNRDGNLHSYDSQWNTMKNAGYGWHVKVHGDGYGYSLHRFLAMGRPVILNYSSVYNSHKLNVLGVFEKDKTIIDFDTETKDSLCQKLVAYSDNWEENSQYVHQRFHTAINFDNEFLKVKRFIEDLL